MILKRLFCVLLLFGCGSEKPKKVFHDVKLNRLVDNYYSDVLTDTLKKIPVHFESIRVPSSQLFNDIHYLPLETTDISLFGGIDQLEITDTQIIILDKKTRGIYVFDKQGQFDFRILEVGGGPQEYKIPKSIAYNPFHDRIEVLDNARGIIQRYSAKDGRYMSTVNYGMGVRRFSPLSDNEYLLIVDSYLFNDERYAQVDGLAKQLLIAEENGNKLSIVSQHIDYRENSGALNFSINQNLRVDRKSRFPLVNLTFNDTIYEVRNEEIRRKYVVDFGNYSNDPEWFLKGNTSLLFKQFEKGEATTVSYFWDTNDYLYVHSRYQNNGTHCFYSKDQEKTRCYKNSDYMQAAGAFALWPIAATDTSFVYVMEPEEVYTTRTSVLNRINQLYPEATQSDIETIIDTFYVAREKWEFLKLAETAIQEDSNPVLVFAKPNFDAYN